MRVAIVSIIISMILGFSSVIQAQVTAVMQAKVNIISGAGLTAIQEPDIDLASVGLTGAEVDAGNFSFVASPGAEVSVHIKEAVPNIENESGETIEMETSVIHVSNHETGEHNISLNGSIDGGQQLKGQYKGNLTAVIEYL